MTDLSEIMGFKNSLENVSLFKDSPFGEHWEKNLPSWALNIFGGARILDTRNIVVADASNRVTYTSVDFYNLLLSPGPKYSFKIFAHPDGIKVLEMYADPKNIPSKDYEVLVFLETDDGQFDFGRIVRVKFGSQVVEDLKNKYFKELPWNDNDPEDVAEKFIKSAWSVNNDPNYNNAQRDVAGDGQNIKNLLTDAIKFEFNNHEFDDFSWFSLLVKGANYFIHQTEDLLFDIAAWLRTKELKDEKYWNGALPDGKYSPPILPDSIFIQDDQKRYDLLKSYFDKNYSNISSTIGEKLQGENTVVSYIRGISDKWLKEFESFTDSLLLEISKIYIPEGIFITVLKHWIAFLVGLWNGILELLASLIELVAIVLMVFTNEIGFKVIDPLIERLENFINAIFNNTKEIIESALHAMANAFMDFADWYNHYNGKSYQICKKIGELIPEILLWVVPELQVTKLSKAEALAVAIERNAAKESLSALPEVEKQAMAIAFKEKLVNGEMEAIVEQSSREVEEKIAKRTVIDEGTKIISEEIQILLKDKNFKAIYEDLEKGIVARTFPQLLTLGEESVLRYYTTNPGYKNLNKALRGEISMTKKFLAQEKLMNDALEKLPKFNTESLLYRIENLSEAELMQHYKAGEYVSNKHFTSSTYSEEAISEAMRVRKYSVLIRIETKNGKLIEKLSTLPVEKEILFKSNTEFLVKEIGFEYNPAEPWTPVKRIILIEK